MLHAVVRKDSVSLPVDKRPLCPAVDTKSWNYCVRQMETYWRHHVEMVSMGAGFPLIPFPCLTQILLKKYETRRVSLLWMLILLIQWGKDLVGMSHVGFCHDTEKSPSFLLVLEIWHLQEGPGRVCWVLQQVLAQSGALVPAKVELMYAS